MFKIIICQFFLLIHLGIFSQTNNFNFPIFIKKIDSLTLVNNYGHYVNEVNDYGDEKVYFKTFQKINTYLVDSLKVNNNIDNKVYFRFLKNIHNPELTFKKNINDNSNSVSIDFEGFQLVNVSNQIYLVYNPYFGLYSKFETINVFENGIENIALDFIPIYTFDNDGNLLCYPTKKRLEKDKNDINKIREEYLNNMLIIGSYQNE